MYRRALEIREKLLGPEHPVVAGSLNNLAGLYDSQGNYERAEPLYQRRLDHPGKSLGPGPSGGGREPEQTWPCSTITWGITAGPNLCISAALSIREKVLGPEHPKRRSA